MDENLTSKFCQVVWDTECFCCCDGTVVVTPLLVKGKTSTEDNVIFLQEEADGYFLAVVCHVYIHDLICSYENIVWKMNEVTLS